MKKDFRSFDLFWENSRLNKLTRLVMRESINKYQSVSRETEKNKLVYAEKPVKLSQPKSRLTTLLSNRKSMREFTPEGISHDELSSILGSLKASDQYHRTYASAGALYPIEFFCLVNRSLDPRLHQKALHYDPENHEATAIGTIPAWNEYKDIIGPEIESEPAIIIILGFFQEQTIAKYGDRGGRFIMYECGLAAQNIDLQVTELGMGGYFYGGSLDDSIKKILDLESIKSLKISLCYLAGHIKQPERKFRLFKSKQK